MTFLEGQIVACFGQLLRAHAETVSGAYKQRKTQQGVDGGGYRDLTDDEKLADMIGQMRAHNRHLSDLCDALPTGKEP